MTPLDTSSPLVFLNLTVAILVAGVWGLLALALVGRVLPKAGIAERSVDALLMFYWVAVAGFEVLALLGLFRLEVVLVLGLLLPFCLAAHFRRRLAESLGELKVASLAGWQTFRRELQAAPFVAGGLAVVCCHLTLRFARAVATPSLGWDDFTYHLYRAGRWVQAGSLKLEASPDAWSYYEFFPWAGDVVWAWTLVWGATDVLVPVAAIGIWLSVLLSVYVLARYLRQGIVTAVVVSFAVATLPSQISLVSTAYVDNLLLWLALIAAISVRQIETQREIENSVAANRLADSVPYWLLGASIGLATVVKLSFLPILSAGAAVAVWQAWRRRRASYLFSFALGASLVIPNLVFNLVHKGSPFYPFRLLDVLPFNEQLVAVLQYSPKLPVGAALMTALRGLVVNVRPNEPFLNFGWLGVGLLLLGVVGSFIFIFRERKVMFVGWLVLCATLVVTPTLGPGGTALLGIFESVLGRLWLPGLAGLMVLAGMTGEKLIRRLVLPLLCVEYFVYAPWKWPVPVGVVTLVVLLLTLALVMANRWMNRRRVRDAVRIAAKAAFLSLALFLTVQVREVLRYDFYRLFGQRRMEDFHSLNPCISGWPIWRSLDTEESLRVAATAGYGTPTGHNWFRYPLMGSRLQNRVLYVPITRDGRVIDYANTEEVLVSADRTAWLSRLLVDEVEYVVAMMPRHVEHQWIEELPTLFSIEQAFGDGNWILAKVVQGELESYLRPQG